MGPLTTADVPSATSPHPPGLRSLQKLGVLCGITAGAWLGAAEIPTKLVSSGLSPFLISLMMVVGVFVGRWTIPVLVRGTDGIRSDVANAPHLVIWAILAGCLWSVANTLTIFAIRDLGLSIAFPLWNTNALIGIGWGVLLFHELKNAGWLRWTAVGSGAVLMFVGGMILAHVSSSEVPSGAATRGIAAALGAGVLWGTMYIPYRKAYLSGMNPLSFVSFFTIGELGMMLFIAVRYSGGFGLLWRELAEAHRLLFWLLAAGFVWVLGDIFQQYAVKYSGISRAIPLSNSNQLWGLLWGAVAFGEFRTWSRGAVVDAIYGSVLMAAGLVAISFSVADESEQKKWRQAAERERIRYGIDEQFVNSSLQGKSAAPSHPRKWFDWAIVAAATGVFVWTASVVEWPPLNLNWKAVYLLVGIGLVLFAAAATALWRTTRFN